MSRMSKYLRQVCLLEKVQLAEDGSPVLNGYGEPSYADPQMIACRKERYIRDVETATGAVMKSSSRFFTSDAVGIDDMLDGKVVLSIEEFTNEYGGTEGYVCVT